VRAGARLLAQQHQRGRRDEHAGGDGGREPQRLAARAAGDRRAAEGAASRPASASPKARRGGQGLLGRLLVVLQQHRGVHAPQRVHACQRQVEAFLSAR
jgi:hypothetical protein